MVFIVLDSGCRLMNEQHNKKAKNSNCLTIYMLQWHKKRAPKRKKIHVHLYNWKSDAMNLSIKPAIDHYFNSMILSTSKQIIPSFFGMCDDQSESHIFHA